MRRREFIAGLGSAMGLPADSEIRSALSSPADSFAEANSAKP
jgi:hypothetical protein